jgi:hypothetical protein
MQEPPGRNSLVRAAQDVEAPPSYDRGHAASGGWPPGGSSDEAFAEKTAPSIDEAVMVAAALTALGTTTSHNEALSSLAQNISTQSA